MPIMIVGHLAIDPACGRIEKSEKVSCAISFIDKVLMSRLMSRCRKGGRDTVEGLNARAFIETVKMIRRMGITPDDMVHLGKEVRICYLQVVFAPMGSKGVLQENPLDGCTADGPSDELRMFFEKPLRITQ